MATQIAIRRPPQNAWAAARSASCTQAWRSSYSSSIPHVDYDLPPRDASCPVFTVWGANTDVGKTLISAGLSASLLNSGSSVSYIKPLQTGFPKDSDSQFVVNKVRKALGYRSPGCNRELYASHTIRHVSPKVLKHHCQSMGDVYNHHEFFMEAKLGVNHGRWCTKTSQTYGNISNSSVFMATTIWSWFDAVSPHVAAESEGLAVADGTIIKEVAKIIGEYHRGTTSPEATERKLTKWVILETAGGVASPGPSRTLQCDLYRHLRLPGLLVGDSKLGGISTTIAAYESLMNRGYDVDAIVLMEHHLGNEDQLINYLHDRLPVLVFPVVPLDLNDDLTDWFSQSAQIFSQLQSVLESSYTKKLNRLQDMKKKAEEVLWWPFTQHSLVPQDKITVIDSRCGDRFTIFKHTGNSEHFAQQFDACASWWTQGPDIHLQLELSKQLGYAAGRFGHVMLPENVHEPALRCAELLIGMIGKGWAQRVYYSDNGSTAIEIAIKMAFRKYLHDNHACTISSPDRVALDLMVIALKNSYHGDTLGAQSAQSPSAYTGFLQQPWYKGRGIFLDAPLISLKNLKWHIHVPDTYFGSLGIADEGLQFDSRDDLFDILRDKSPLADIYKTYISHCLNAFKQTKSLPAALIIEPVIHGAGGMTLVDPLFQRLLVKECNAQKIPVIFDEVFCGCWRLGVQSCTEYLHCTPDIGCYSKLLTGGTIPLAVTLASSSVFESFKGNSKLLALLHGHSYSGHAIGCQAAVTSLKWLGDSQTNPNLLPSKKRLIELWDPEMVAELSSHPAVERVISLGTVFALELKTSASDNGYASMFSQTLVQALRDDGIYNRPIGNVIYFMCTPMTSPFKCSKLLQQLSKQLDRFHQHQ